MTRRSDLEMAVVHLGRAMRSLSRSGMDESTPMFRRASSTLALASNQLIDAIEASAATPAVNDDREGRDSDPAGDSRRAGLSRAPSIRMRRQVEFHAAHMGGGRRSSCGSRSREDGEVWEQPLRRAQRPVGIPPPCTTMTGAMR